MAAAAAVLMAIGGITSFASGMLQADAEKDASDFNAALDEQSAGLVAQQTVEDERVFRVNARQAIGSEIAGYGASGISSSEGSAAEVIRASAANAELDALKLRTEGQNKAQAYRDSARLERQQGGKRETANRLSAVSALFGAGGKIASGYGGSTQSVAKGGK